jgi:hypothetical protein
VKSVASFFAHVYDIGLKLTVLCLTRISHQLSTAAAEPDATGLAAGTTGSD